MEKYLTDFERELLEIELRNKPPAYMNSAEAAAYLNFCESVFRKEISPFLFKIRKGKRIVYRKPDLDKYMESLLVSPERVVKFK